MSGICSSQGKWRAVTTWEECRWKLGQREDIIGFETAAAGKRTSPQLDGQLEKIFVRTSSPQILRRDGLFDKFSTPVFVQMTRNTEGNYWEEREEGINRDVCNDIKTITNQRGLLTRLWGDALIWISDRRWWHEIKRISNNTEPCRSNHCWAEYSTTIAFRCQLYPYLLLAVVVARQMNFLQTVIKTSPVPRPQSALLSDWTILSTKADAIDATIDFRLIITEELFQYFEFPVGLGSIRHL